MLSPGGLFRAVRRVERNLIHQTDPVEILNEAVSILTGEVESSAPHAWLVHWDGSKQVGSAQSGPVPARSEHWPACLRGGIDCQGCSLRAVQLGTETIVPLRHDQSCEGALLLEGRDYRPEELELLAELGDDLGRALQRTARQGQNGPDNLALTTIFDLMLAGIVVIRISDRRIVEANAGMQRLVGWSIPEMLGRTIEELELFVVASEIPRLRLAFAEQGSLMPLECRLRRKNGEEADFLLTAGAAEIAGEACAIQIWHDISQLREADAARRESDRQARAIFEMAPVGIVQADPQSGRLLAVNDRFCSITGYSSEELLGMTVAELGPPQDSPRALELFGALTRGEIPGYPLDRRYLRKDGSIAWVHVDVTLLRDCQGTPTRTLAVVEDVTPRKQWEERLQIYRAALEAAANGVIISDRQGKVEQFNLAAAALANCPETEFLGASPFLEPPDLREAVLQGQGWQGEFLRVRPDGSRYHEDLTLTPIRNEAAEVTHFVAIQQDISERILAEHSLRRSEERYRELLDHLEDVVFALEPGGRISFVSPSIRRLGYQPSDLIGRHVARFLVHADRALLRSSCLNSEWRILDRDGKARWFRINLNRHPGRKVVGGVAIDVTAQKAIEEQLLAAQKMEAVGRLAGGIAHDFNNMLTVILSYTELALEQLPANHPISPDLQEVMQAGDRAKSLTRQLLAFGRRQVMSLETLDLNELVASVERMLARLIGEDIQIRLNPAASPCLVRGDRSQLEQVLLNLAVNARDAMPQGGELSITTSCRLLSPEEARSLEVEPGMYAEIQVLDCGCGIEQAVQAHIFEPFFTTKEIGKGTGLGLAMVYGILRQSAGAVRVKSRPGEGTRFDLYLPLVAAAACPVRMIPTGQTRSDGDETILVVEDEPSLRTLVIRTLSQAGYHVHVAANGAEAIGICQQRGSSIDLVLSDVVMPGLSGPDLLLRLRPYCPQARFLLMSGYPYEALAGRGVSEHEYLPKPFDGPALSAAVRSRLDHA